MNPILSRPLLGLCCALWLAASPAEAITFRMSQVGYHPKASKIVVVEDIPADTPIKAVLYDPTKRNPKFPVLLGAVVYEIQNVRTVQDKSQQGPAAKSIRLDFSDFTIPGNYEILLEGTDIKSPEVTITDFIYWDSLISVVKSFYFQRCGQEVEDRENKLYHAACHLDDAQPVGSGRWQDLIGGWHNGGDYAKYATSTSLSAARLLSMYEWNPKPYKYFRLGYPLQEPRLGDVADLHHEVKAGLDWLLQLQQRNGSVLRKVAGKKWPETLRPEDDLQERFAYGASTPDTANFAAVMALASRNFKTEDLGYSVKTLLAAERAWSFLEANPQLIYERSDSDFAGSGEFWDGRFKNDLPQRVWAAAELYITTGKDKYHQYFLKNYDQVAFEPFSWYNPAMQGFEDYLFHAENRDPAVAATLKQNLALLGNRILDSLKNGTYPSSLDRYLKGSNQTAVENASALMAAARATGDEKYRHGASQIANYLFGVNPFSRSYVTGIGQNAVKNPAHRWMQATDKLIPGYLVAGPDENAAESLVPKNAGARSYVDSAKAAGVNESTILNNASMAHLLGILNTAYNVGREHPLEGLQKFDPRKL